MSECTHDCSSCGESCSERTSPQSFQAPANELSHIKKVIAVVSGKGGVGKSLVTSSLAVSYTRLMLPNGAGIHQHQVGLMLVVGKAVAHLAQIAPQALRVGLVLLAAIGVHHGQDVYKRQVPSS